MKSLNKIKCYWRIIFITAFLLSISQYSVKAQTEEDDEDESGFFGDGLNSNHFESDFNNSYNQSKPTYEYKSTPNSNPFGNENNSPQNTFDLDIEVHRKYSYENGTTVIGGGSGGSNQGNYNSSNSSGSNTIYGIPNSGSDPNIKNPNFNSPENPGDPDAPIDGKIWILLLVGLVFGFRKLHKQEI